MARSLLLESWTLFRSYDLGDQVFTVSCGGDPAKVYDRQMQRSLLFQRMEEVLSPRELNLVRCYLGIGQPEEQGMTFQELAIRLNYNGPSGAEKAYKSAIRKLRQYLHGGDYGRWLDIQRTIQYARRKLGRRDRILLVPGHVAGGAGTDPGLSLQDSSAAPRVSNSAHSGRGGPGGIK